MISVFVVDDSPMMRGMICRLLQRESDIVVIGESGNPVAAFHAIRELRPDVVTLDVEMPGMNGLDFLRRLMRHRPMPVVMVSSLTTAGAETTLRAIELGAVECVAKPRRNAADEFDRLPELVRAAKQAQLRPPRPSMPPRVATGFVPTDRVVAIGASTGGVEALIEVLSTFPANCPPTLITQHLPAAFTPTFAQRLDRSCAATVREAEDGAPLSAGKVYLAPGGVAHLEMTGPPGGPWLCRLSTAGPVNNHRPSVDVLFDSVAVTAGANSVGVILTGMGRDGARGLLAMRKAGARTIGQDERTSVIYGMPKSAHDAGAVQVQVPLGGTTEAILAACHLKGLPGWDRAAGTLARE